MPLFFSGPSGGVGGRFRDDSEAIPSPGDLEDAFVTSVDIRHGLFIDFIALHVQSKSTGATFHLERGGPGGGQLSQVRVRRNQVISAIRGFYGRFIDSLEIDVLDIGTGVVDTHGPFGGPGGNVGYVYQAPVQAPVAPVDSGIVGFFGGAGRFIDSIGVIVRRPL